MPAEVKNPIPLKVGSKAVVADVIIPTEHDVKVESRNFVLGSAGAFGLGSGTDIPDWLNAAITAEIASGTTDLRTVVDALGATLRGLDDGVQQQISSLQAADIATNTLLTTNVSRLDNDVAANLSLVNTKVTDTEAETIAFDLLQSQFTTPSSEANAWFTTSSSTLTTDVAANAADITGLGASVNGLNAELLTTNFVTVGLDQWEVGSSKLAIGPDGSVTGWQFNDGSAMESTFAIAADHFYIESSSVPGYKPFSVDGTAVSFNGIVDFTATNINGGFPGTTTINGGLIETNTVTASQINTTGLIAENIYSAEIHGKNIYGAYIEGAVIKASYLDLDGELSVVTNYHLYTSQAQMDAGLLAGEKGELYTNEIDMPGAIYMEGQDEWRLPSTSALTIYAETKSYTTTYDAACTYNYKIVTGTKVYQNELFGAFDSYGVITPNRLVKDKPIITIADDGGGIDTYRTSQGSNDMTGIEEHKLWFFNISMGSVTNVRWEGSYLKCVYQGVTLSVYGYPTYGLSNVDSHTATINGMQAKVTIVARHYPAGLFTVQYWAWTISLEIVAGDYTPTIDLSGTGGIAYEYIGATKCSGSIYESIDFPTITVNNLL